MQWIKSAFHPPPPRVISSRQGFTLIELSIVLVIVGLLIGGVLVGQDIIKAAAVRAQVGQIEKFNTAVNTFRVKYNYLPGDIPDPDATRFGFAPRGSYAGEGDGDGNIVGITANAPNSVGQSGNRGEAVMFWVDLSTARLIDGGFNAASPIAFPGGALQAYLPASKLGNQLFIYIWNGPLVNSLGYPDYVPSGGGMNFFALSTVTGLGPGQTYGEPGITVSQAYNIDTKIDDGLPQSGNVTAMYLNSNCCLLNPVWAAGGLTNDANAAASSGYPIRAPTTNATVATDLTCYDNGGVSGPQQYSITRNKGSGVNCALSFKMQ